MDDLGKWLKIMRIKESLTLKQFAAIMGKSAPYVCGIESGRIKPAKNFVDKFLSAFPQYEKHREYIINAVEQRRENMELILVFSKKLRYLHKRISLCSEGEQQNIYNEIDILLTNRGA